MTSLTIPDFIVLAGYFALMLGIGVFFYRRVNSAGDFFRGGSHVPWWLSGASFYMSTFSALGFVMYAALAYEFGIVAVTLYWCTVPAVLFSVLFLAGRWRRARMGSPLEYLENRYGITIRQLFAWQGIPVKIIDSGLKLVAIASFLSVSFGLTIPQSIIGSGLVLLAYTFLGGLWGVLVTDFVQFLVLLVGALILFPLSISRAGGFTAIYENVPTGYFRPFNGSYDHVYVISFIVIITLAYSSVYWSLIQRYQCVSKETDARKVGWMVIVLNIITPPLLFLPGLAATQFLADVPDTKQVYPLLCQALLPGGLLGLIIAAMFAATMSSLSSDFNVTANVLTVDVYQRLFRRRANGRELVWVGRGMTLVVGVLAISLALGMSNLDGQGLFKTTMTLFGIATAPIALPMILGLLSRRVTHGGAASGFILGLVVGLGVYLTLNGPVLIGPVTLSSPHAIFWAATIASAVGLLIGTVLLPKSPHEEVESNAFMEKLRCAIGELPEDNIGGSAAANKELVTVLRMVGFCAAYIAIMLLCVAPMVGGGLSLLLVMIMVVALALFSVGMIFAGVRLAGDSIPSGTCDTTSEACSSSTDITTEGRA
jgi:solute:Na+ symporter, SSS family